MDLGTFVRRVQSGFGDEDEITIYIQEIIDWLNEAQAYVVRETQCLRETITTPANTFPIIIDDMFLLDKAAYGQTIIPQINRDNISDWYTNPVIGVPQYYYLNGSEIVLWPTPPASDATSVAIQYVPSPEDIQVDDPDNTPLQVPLPYHNDLVIFALARAHEKNENYRAAELKMTEFQGNVAYRRFEIQQGTSSNYVVAGLKEDYVDNDCIL